MTYKTNNIPRKTFHTTMSAEILSITRATTKFQEFVCSLHVIRNVIKQNKRRQGGGGKPYEIVIF